MKVISQKNILTNLKQNGLINDKNDNRSIQQLNLQEYYRLVTRNDKPIRLV